MELSHAHHFAGRRNSRIVVVAFWAAILVLFLSKAAGAADYFVRDGIAESGVALEEAKAAAELVRNAVAARAGDRLFDDESRAQFILQPRLLKLGDSWVLTVEKLAGSQIVFAAQSKVPAIDQLDRAARSATMTVMGEAEANRGIRIVQVAPAPVAPVATTSATSISATSAPVTAPPPAPIAVAPAAEPETPTMGRSVGRTVDVLPAGRKMSYWSIGAGPFLGRWMNTDNVMYDFAFGHNWDINPRATVKLTAETDFSSGNENARFLNLSVGANYYLPPSMENAPYVSTDMGYGYARSGKGNTAEGFSLGIGAGYQFFRTTETTMDLLLRYAIVFDEMVGGGNPSVTGLRLAVNF